MSYQRKHGQPAKVWMTKDAVDRRGNLYKQAVPDDAIDVRAAFIPQRSSRAEVPGQQSIDITRMIVDADLPNVSLWSRVEWNGAEWDVVTPPAYHHGTRRTRHWSIDIRKRPHE